MDMNPLTEVPEVKVAVKNGELRYGVVIDSKLTNVVPMKEKTEQTPYQPCRKVSRT